MYKYLQLLIVFGIHFFLMYAGNLSAESYDTLVVSDDLKEVKLGKYIRYLSDSTNRMDLQDFLETTSPTEASLRVNTKKEVYLGYGQHQYWFQIHLRSALKSPKLFFLNIAYPDLDHFIVYQNINLNDRDSIVTIAEMGDDFVNGNKILSHRNYLIPVEIQPNESTDYIIQIKKQWEPINFPMFLSNEYTLVRRTNNDNLFIGIFFGVHLLFVLTLFSLFLFTRNNFFILYMLYSVFVSLNILSDTGIGLQYIWTNWAAVQKVIPYIVTFGTILIHIIFIRLFFRTSLHLVKFNQILLTVLFLIFFTIISLVLFALIFPSSNLPFQIGYNVINGIYLGYGVMILILCVVTMLQVRRKEVVWIGVVVFIQFLSWVIQIIARGNAFSLTLRKFSIYDWNLFPSQLSTPHIIIVMIALEILVVSIILSMNFYRYIKDNSSGEYKLLMMGRNTINAYIDGQENERVKLMDRINNGLGQDISLLIDQMNSVRPHIKNPEILTKYSKIIGEVQSINSELQKITMDFVPSEYFNKSFYESVKSIFNPLINQNIQVTYQLSYPAPVLNDFSKVNVCRILQEIAGNITKHAQAKQVQVKIYYKEFLIIQIQDNGVGFEQNNNDGGIGLMNIESRVKGMNGELDIQSEKGSGTLLIIKVPFKEIK